MPLPNHLPCRLNPTACTDHAHWPTSPNRSSKNSTTEVPTWLLPRLHAFTSKAVDLVPPPKFSLQSLPIEILDQICIYLTRAEKASLALTCHSLAFSLWTKTWEAMTFAGTGSWVFHDAMLDLLQRDFDPMQWWRCGKCMKFHRRTRERLGAFAGLCRWVARGGRKRVLQYGISGDAVYALDFELVEEVMKRHFLGPQHGICLASLQCRGKRAFQFDDTSTVELAYAFSPKIVLDRLLLHSHYTFEPLPINFVDCGIGLSFSSARIVKFLSELDFWFCAHQSTRSSKSTGNLMGLMGVQYVRCPFCPTEYGMYLDMRKYYDPGLRELGPNIFVVIDVWQNLGEGQTPRDSRWRALVRHGARHEYQVEDENIRQAYRRIFCSTRQEFERQVKTAERRNGWVYSETLDTYIHDDGRERWKMGNPCWMKPWKTSPFKSLPSALARNL